MAVYRLLSQSFERQYVEKKKNITWCLTIHCTEKWDQICEGTWFEFYHGFFKDINLTVHDAFSFLFFFFVICMLLTVTGIESDNFC